MTDEVKKERPKLSDLGWSDYVMSQLDDSELVEGAPTTDGLRRMVELLIGEIHNIDSTVVQAPNPGNHDRAVVRVKVTIFKPEGEYRDFSASADACRHNVDGAYGLYPTAMAETRALGRAYRLILRMKKAVAEEISERAEKEAANLEPITSNQISGINTLCKKLNINVKEFVNSTGKVYKNVKEVSKDKGMSLMKELNDYQRNAQDIPADVVGYDKNWQEKFGS